MEAWADFRTVAAVAPSSRYLAQAMLGPLPLSRARTVVEVGCGTGVITQAILNVIPSDATLLAFEINHRFNRYLKSIVSDPRMVLINANAETLQKELHSRGHQRVDAIISSLGLGFMTDAERDAFLNQLDGLLDETGVFTQYHYIHGCQFRNGKLQRFNVEKLLRRHFRSVQRTIIWRNLPPAYVFVCRGPVRPEVNSQVASVLP